MPLPHALDLPRNSSVNFQDFLGLPTQVSSPVACTCGWLDMLHVNSRERDVGHVQRGANSDSKVCCFLLPHNNPVEGALAMFQRN